MPEATLTPVRDIIIAIDQNINNLRHEFAETRFFNVTY